MFYQIGNFFPLERWLSVSWPTLFFILIFSALHSYEVRFEGIGNPETLELIREVSQLEKLKDTPPPTLMGLKRRAQGDMLHVIQVFHTFARYHASADFSIEENGNLVLVKVNPGPVYPLAIFRICYRQNGEENENLPHCPISLQDLSIQIGEPATPERILDAEDLLLDHLNLQGYAFAKILKRDVFADQENQNVIVLVDVETGPLTYFGRIKITGLERVHENFIFKKLKWDEGDLYQPSSIEKTQEALDLTGLFRSVNITQSEDPVNGDLLELELNFIEAKQRTIGYGINYNTQLGPGVSAEWEDRNVFGEGQKLSFRTDLWWDWQFGTATYLIPDYKRQNQNLIWQLNYEQGHRRAYSERAISLSAIIERRFNKELSFSYGAMYKHLLSEHSERNGTFNLFKVPLQFKWSTVDNILDPTEGASFHLSCIPSWQFLSPQFAYSINTLTSTFYKPLTEDKNHVFAAKFMFGSIIGAGKHDIPPPERFYAGSQNTIRGYRYLTVSPLEWRQDHDYKPIGGRSMFIYSLELRSRITKNFGLVGFWDIGNVYSNAFPDFKQRLLQSTGLGIRYYTPVGPLRLDIAVPLNRRKHIDNSVEIYFSIGQSF
jgi:translocation and assembly module TamA